jgi:flagellar hook-associated protein 1
MSISGAMSKAVQGLNATARATDIVSENIANAQTPGYVSRDIRVNERIVDGKAAGLSPIKVISNRDTLGTQEVRRSQISYQRQSVISNASAKITEAVGDVNSEYSLSSQYDRMMNAFRNLAETPENAALQDETINNARLFARTVRETAGTMQTLREEADSQIRREVDFINKSLYDLKSVVGTIVSQAGTGDISALADERDRIIDAINERIPLQVFEESNGAVKVATKNGLNLFDLTVTELEFTQTTEIPPEVIYSYPGEAPGLPYSSTLSGLTLGGIDITPTADKIMSIQGGKLGGLFEVRDNYTVTVQKQLDSMSSHLIKQFRSADTSLSAIVPQDSVFTSTVPGATYATVTDTLGIANNFTVNTNIDPDKGGDKRRIRDGAEATTFGPSGNGAIIRGWITATDTNVAFDSSTNLSPSQTVSQSIREFTSLVSLNNQSEKNSANFEEGKLNAIIDSRDNAQGVNIDNEMQKIVFLEKLYAANAVLLRTAGEMLDQLLSVR